MSQIEDGGGEIAAGEVGGDNRPIFSVGEISQLLKRTVEENFSHVRVRGEVTRFTRASSGHLYLTLKDENAVLDGVCWRGVAGRLQIQPEEGMEVIATGRLSTYSGRSSYQIIIEALEIAGAGALLKLLEDRRKKLAALGLFAEERKRDLPFLPDVIGVVTSPTGAVIRDILHRLADRFPRHVLLWPVVVQGDAAASQIAAAIQGFNALDEAGAVPRPDLLIIARGGGSLEDLWAFNEEVAVRAAAASTIPLISAIGHETDTTLIDFAADRRAPTPSAAAEMAVPVRSELVQQTSDDANRMMRAMFRLLDRRGEILQGLGRGLPDRSRIVEEAAQRLDDRALRLANGMKNLRGGKGRDLSEAARLLRPRPLIDMVAAGALRLGDLAPRADRALDHLLADCASGLARAGEMLRSLSHERVLERGFALITDRQGRPVTSVAMAPVGSDLGLRFHDGAAVATVIDAPSRKKPAKRSKKSDSDDGQGSLL